MYGFYVIAEAYLESHGTISIYGGTQERTPGLLVQNPQFEKASWTEYVAAWREIKTARAL